MENLSLLQQMKQSERENHPPSSLIINNNQAHLIDHFYLIKQRYASLADFNLSKGKLIHFFPKNFDLDIALFQMENNYELHLNPKISSWHSNQSPMVDTVIVGKVESIFFFFPDEIIWTFF